MIPETWLLLTLFSAFCLASADALTKRYLFDYSGWELIAVRFGVPAILLLPVVIAYPPPAELPPAFWGWIALLLPLEFLAALLYLIAVRDSPLHLTLPYLAFTPVFNVATGWLLLGERVSLQGLAGIVLVVVGAYLLNFKGFGTGSDSSRLASWLAPLRAIGSETGSILMLGAAALYSLTSVMGKRVMVYATPESFGALYLVLLGSVFLLLFGMAGRGQVLRLLVRRPWVHLLVGVTMALMVVVHFLALARVEVAYMIAVKRTSLLFGILYGALWFGERQVRQHLMAGGLMVVGVALIVA